VATTITLEQWLELQKVRLMARFPFFGILLSYLRLVPDSKVEVAATDGVGVYYNPTFFGELMARGDDLTAQGLLVHETLHPAFGHFWREGNRDHVLWNAATDYVINLIIRDLGLKLPPGGCLDERYRGLSEEEVFSRLPPREQIVLPSWILDLLEPALGGAGQSGATGVPVDLAGTWRDRVTAAAQAAKQRGVLPSGIARMIERLLNPTKDWRAVLGEFVVPTSADYDWRRLDRRLLDLDVYLPTLSGEEVDNLVVALDTSGSVDDGEMARMLAELRGILAAYDRVRVTVMACDAKVYEVFELDESSWLPQRMSGGGGTSTRPVFEKIRELDAQPYALIYLTDGYADYPEYPPEYPVLWVLTPDHQTPPWGRVTVLDK
jgi:predicted metal-dependent peptidase